MNYSLKTKKKKQIGQNAKHRASRKKGYKGSMRMPFDYLTSKEKKDLLRGGVIMESNLYEKIENIPTYEEFINWHDTDYEKGRNILLKIREFAQEGKYTNTQIAKHFDKPYQSYSNLLKKYNIPLINKNNSKKKNKI